MKSSKSNTEFLVATKEFSLRHRSHDLSTTSRRSSEPPFDFTMQYLRHREPAYVLVNRRKQHLGLKQWSLPLRGL